jgi:glycosyltransferase involved in cell wall biosynthesis
MNGRAEFSVVIPAYQSARLIHHALDSVVSQTHRPAEVFVVDDGSTDDLASVVDRYEDVTLIRQDNAGVGAARNAGIRRATSDWVVFLDADDYWSPTRLEAMADHAARHPDHGLITTDALVVDGDGNILWRYCERVPFVHVDQRAALMAGNFVFISSAAKRTLVEAVGGFDEDRVGSAAADWDMWMRLVLAGTQIGFVDQPLAFYVQHGENMSEDVFGMRRAELRVVDRLFESGDFSKTERETLRRMRRERTRSLLRADLERLTRHGTPAARWLSELIRDPRRRSERLRGVVSAAGSRLGYR